MFVCVFSRDGQNNMLTALCFSNTVAQPALSPGGFVLPGSSASTKESFQLSRFSCDVMINGKLTMTDSKHKLKTSNCCQADHCRIVCRVSFFLVSVGYVTHCGRRPHSEALTKAADERSLSEAATDGPSVAQLIPECIGAQKK